MAHSENAVVLDDRRSGDERSNLGTPWRLVTDGVMGGVSRGRLVPDQVDGRPCLRLTGEVSLENHGGFIQAALDLSQRDDFDASGWQGVELEVRGNAETYNLHLRTRDLRLPWQSYRASFQAAPRWQVLRLPFSDFRPYQTDRQLDLGQLRRIALVAIGKAYAADLCLARLALYR